MINGTLNDVVITKLPVEINVKTNEVTTITASFNFVAYGCEKCNTFAGQVSIYNASNLAFYINIPGTTDNP